MSQVGDRPSPVALRDDESREDPLQSATHSHGEAPMFAARVAPNADADHCKQQQISNTSQVNLHGAEGAPAPNRSSFDEPRTLPLSTGTGSDMGPQTSIRITDEERAGDGTGRGGTAVARRPLGIENVLVCFSLPRNIGKIFHVAPAKADVEQLDCLHGLRFMSMLWVIWGHSFVFALNYAGLV